MINLSLNEGFVKLKSANDKKSAGSYINFKKRSIAEILIVNDREIHIHQSVMQSCTKSSADQRL